MELEHSLARSAIVWSPSEISQAMKIDVREGDSKEEKKEKPLKITIEDLQYREPIEKGKTQQIMLLTDQTQLKMQASFIANRLIGLRK